LSSRHYDAVDLVVWRHGRTEWNDTGRFQGHVDVPLDSVGHAQAAAAAPALALLRPVGIVSSDLARAAETAAYLGSLCDLPVLADARLRELDVGDWGGLSRSEVIERYPATYAAWLAGEDVRREGGETMSELADRAVAAVTDALAGLDTTSGPLVAVSHGGTSRALVVSLLGLPSSAGARFAALGNARWAGLARRDDGWRLSTYNVGRDPAAAEPGNDDASAGPVL
jgi:probable phosphoglycerate mutase